MSKGKASGLKGIAAKGGATTPQPGGARKPSMPVAPRMVQRKASARGR